MGAIEDFKKFALKGNVMDLAAGVIIGGAFGKVVSTLVDKAFMPPIGLLIGGVHFSQLRVVLQAAGADGKGEVAIGYGDLIEACFDFLLVALALFAIVKLFGAVQRWEERAAEALRLRKAAETPAEPQPPPPPPPPEAQSVELLKEIRDLLAKGEAKPQR